MKKITAILVSFAFVVAGFTSLVVPTAAHAQALGASCEAQSPQALGIGRAATRDMACAIALNECSVRTPYYERCVVTRWWWN